MEERKPLISQKDLKIIQVINAVFDHVTTGTEPGLVFETPEAQEARQKDEAILKEYFPTKQSTPSSPKP